jgi:hypothetical protein
VTQAQAVQRLPGKLEALSSNPGTAKKKKKTSENLLLVCPPHMKYKINFL